MNRMRHRARFLTARWVDLAMMNFEIDPRVLAPLVPCGTEVDLWQGTTLVSLVGFEFRDARLLALSIPFHRNFVEVNLRFYVRRRTPDGWRRGVVFVKELVPRRAVAWTARRFYGENFSVARMGHRIEPSANSDEPPLGATYEWTFAGGAYRLDVSGDDRACVAADGSEAQFVVEHYWGYSGGVDSRPTFEYQVEHAPWRVRQASEARFSGDVARLYGPQFVDSLSAQPASAWLVDGSAVNVYRGTRLSAAEPRAADADESPSTRYTGRDRVRVAQLDRASASEAEG
jgi:uncharacterized protein YqjF (DUF2071 family)